MVATRRAVRRTEPKSSLPGRSDSTGVRELPLMEGSTTARATRRKNKVSSQLDVIPESNFEKMKEPEKKPAVEAHLEMQATQSRIDVARVPDSVAELPIDGYISEAESNCSSVSGLQTPLFIRVTRRRQIVVPCQSEPPAKNRQSRRVLPNEDSKCQEEDISESESCCSTVSGGQTSSAARKTRSRQVKTNVLTTCEAQAEEVSDAESSCSGVSTEPSVQFKRITRSMRLRPQVETIPQGERKSEAIVEDEKLPRYVTKSWTIVISDSESIKSDSDKQASCLSTTQINEQPNPSKLKNHSESITDDDLKERLSGSPKTADKESTKMSSKKENRKDRDCEIAVHREKKSGKSKNIRKSAKKETSIDSYEKSRKVIEKLSPVKSTATFSSQTTANKDNLNMETKKPDIRGFTQSCFSQAELIIEVDKLYDTDNPQSNISSQTIESSKDDCRASVVSIDSNGSQETDVEFSSYATKITGDERHSTMSVLISDDSNESDSSDLEETNEIKMTASCADRSNQNALDLDNSHSEVLFIIDKTPGLDSTKAYYLEEKDTEIEGKDTKSKTSSELDENEEEFIDEDEGLLNVTTKGLVLSSSIDPGLNIRDLGGLYINLNAGKQKPGSHGIVPLKEEKKDELLQKSIITPDFEKRECIPPLRESVRQLKKQRRAEREKSTGDGWFGMKAPEMTDELKNDLQALKMRAAIDPKRFYKKNDREGLPKYFQVGTVVDSPVDFYHARIPKKERKNTIVEELLADAEFRRYNKRKYQEIMVEKAALAAGKKNKKKKKFIK